MTKNMSSKTAPARRCQMPSKMLSEVKERYIPQPITIKPNHRNLSKTSFMISNSCASDKCLFPLDDCFAIVYTSLCHPYKEASGVI